MTTSDIFDHAKASKRAHAQLRHRYRDTYKRDHPLLRTTGSFDYRRDVHLQAIMGREWINALEAEIPTLLQYESCETALGKEIEILKTTLIVIALQKQWKADAPKKVRRAIKRVLAAETSFRDELIGVKHD